jgi:hypothetical protein
MVSVLPLVSRTQRGFCVRIPLEKFETHPHFEVPLKSRAEQVVRPHEQPTYSFLHGETPGKPQNDKVDSQSSSIVIYSCLFGCTSDIGEQRAKLYLFVVF